MRSPIRRNRSAVRSTWQRSDEGGAHTRKKGISIAVPSPSQLSRSGAVSLADMSNTRDEREALKQTKKRKREKRTKRKSLWDITSLSKDQLFLCCLRALLLPPSGSSQQKRKRKATNRDKEMEKTRTIRCY